MESRIDFEMKKAAIFLILGLVGVVACSGYGRELIEVRGTAMETEWSVKVVTAGPAVGTKQTVRRLTEGQLELVNARMSHYLDSSEVSRFNASFETTPFLVSPETADVVRHALEIGALTGGALDVTVAPLVDAWGFGPRGEGLEIPSEEDMEHLLTTTGLDLLRLDPLMPAITKRVPGLRIDLSAVAKGYAVDRVAEALLKAGHANFMVEIGGEIRVHGHNLAGVPWRLGIERPQVAGREIHTVVLLTDGSLATSGDYRLFREIEGRWISHIIDPRSGRPVEHRLASVSVVDDLCVRADAYATALLVLGPDEGMRLAEEEDLAVLFLTQGDGGQIVESSSPKFDQLGARTVNSDNTEETS
jgi:thiamine biosynthesis lipoprotein